MAKFLNKVKTIFFKKNEDRIESLIDDIPDTEHYEYQLKIIRAHQQNRLEKLPTFHPIRYEHIFQKYLKVQTPNFPIGHGGYGTVFAAADINTRSKAKFAVKVVGGVDNEITKIKFFMKDVKWEIHLLQTLQHPNIVKYYDNVKFDFTGVVDAPYQASKLPYYVAIKTELLEASLSEVVGTMGMLTLAQVVVLIRQIGAAIAFLHEQGIAHHDIKPGNIMISHVTDKKNLNSLRAEAGTFVYKLIDLGCAHRHATPIETATERRFRPGTMGFMPAEKISGAEFNPFLADAYGFGMVLAICLIGLLTDADVSGNFVLKLRNRLKEDMKLEDVEMFTGLIETPEKRLFVHQVLKHFSS